MRGMGGRERSKVRTDGWRLCELAMQETPVVLEEMRLRVRRLMN